MLKERNLTGGLSSVIAGGNFWQGMKQGLITTGLNDLAHWVTNGGSGKDPGDPDENKDGKLQKNEADSHYLEGNGKDVFVDGNKIDLTGLKAEHMTYNSKTGIYSLATTKAFKVLPWETAATYGGSSFKLVDGKFRMFRQEYHYRIRSWNSLENIGRNVLNIIGDPTNTLRPSQMNSINGIQTYDPKSYFINFKY